MTKSECFNYDWFYSWLSRSITPNLIPQLTLPAKYIADNFTRLYFEVDEDIAVKFYEKFKYLYNIDDIISKGKIKENKQKYNIDTVLINKTVLLNLGLQDKNIIDCDICTVCNSDKFHSYRVDKEASGRNTGIITLI